MSLDFLHVSKRKRVYNQRILLNFLLLICENINYIFIKQIIYKEIKMRIDFGEVIRN